MTIKRPKSNLKRLFIFNGLLLVVAFAIIQYSVMMHDDAPTTTAQPLPAEITLEYESILNQRSPFNFELNGMVAQRTDIFNPPITLPDIQFKTAFDKGQSLDGLKGQWVILNFWATWCPPCIREMPSLQSLQDQYGGQGIRVVAISLDRGMDAETLRWFMADKKFGPVAAYYGDWMTVKNQVNIKGLPNTFILSPNGQAVAVVRGELDWASADAKAFVEGLVNDIR